MPSKGKKSNTRPANQPSLFSFWSKKTKAQTGIEEKEAQNGKRNDSARPQDRADAVTAKKRRVETAKQNSRDMMPSMSSPMTNPMDASSGSTAHQRVAVTPPEEKSPLSSNFSAKGQNLTNSNIQVANVQEKDLGKVEEVVVQNSVQVADATTLSSDNNSEALGAADEKENISLQKATINKPKRSAVSPEPKAEETDDSEEEQEDQQLQKTSPQTIDYKNNNPQGLSDYEMLRLRNIARNNARLEALGLLASGATTSSAPKKKSKRPSKKPAKSQQSEAPPTRRSTRLSQPKTAVVSQDQNEGESQLQSQQSESNDTPPHAEMDQYEVSPVVQYEMQQTSQQEDHKKSTRIDEFFKGSSSSCNDNHQTQSPTLVPCNYRLAPSQGLSAIYSLNVYQDTPWVVGAGKSGIVALWNYCHEEENNDNDDDTETDYYDIDPVFTWKAHSGRWISEAQFLPSDDNNRAPTWLATAANDGTVCLWDLSQVSTTTGIPKLQQQSNKSWHTSGIFAMDVRSNTATAAKIATGSKDKTVAVASIGGGSNFSPTWRSYCHEGKVGAVQFRDDHVLATASDDGTCAILDDRMAGEDAAPVALLENLHQGRPHSVIWGPSTTHQHDLLTAGLDSVIQRWDIRYLSKTKNKNQLPLEEFYGHIPVSSRRCKRIHHPVFYHSNNASMGAGSFFILTGGEGSHSLSMFQYGFSFEDGPEAYYNRNQVNRSSVYSRGILPNDCSHTDVGALAVQTDLVLTTVEGQVLLLKPPN